MDAVSLVRWWDVLNAGLSLHASGIFLADLSRAWSQVECIGSDQILTLWWLPLGALPRRNVRDVHRVDLLKSTTLVLHEEEVGDRDGDERAGGENVAVLVVDGAGDEWRKE